MIYTIKMIGILLLVTSSCFSQIKINLDGHWWNRNESKMRKGAVDGVVDCLTWERHQQLPQLTLPVFADHVDSFYKAGSLNVTIDQVLLSLPKIPRASRKGGEDFSKEKHGIFDELYWVSGNVEQQTGFVTGYITCTGQRMPSQPEVARVVAAVSKWYEAHETSDAKVANVIAIVQRKAGQPRMEK